MLYLWKIERLTPYDFGNYIAAVVVAASEDEAREIYPEYGCDTSTNLEGEWPEDTSTLKVMRIGIADDGLTSGTVILSGFLDAQ